MAFIIYEISYGSDITAAPAVGTFTSDYDCLAEGSN